MGACCQGQSHVQEDFEVGKAPIQKPGRSKSSRKEGKNIRFDPSQKQKNAKVKSRNNPNFNPYKNLQVKKVHFNKDGISKMFNGVRDKYFVDKDKEMQEAQEEFNENEQEINTDDITTQINLKIVTNKYQKMIEYLEENGIEKYQDQDFPTVLESISKYPEVGLPEAEEYNWECAEQCVDMESAEKMGVFTKGVSPNDIVQGGLGDCYFLCGLSALAERPGLIKRLFKTKNITKNGLYCVWLCINGEWQEILLDDNFPCQDGKPVFSSSVSEELWVLLLEKAYAKIFGGYDKIEAGLSGEAIRDLTGCPFKWTWTDVGPEAVWQFICEHDDQGHIMTIGTQQEAPEMEEAKDGRPEQDMGQGIVTGHAYSILDHRVVTVNDEEVKLVQIRNPWGQYEWKGDWSDNSPLWTEELKAELGYSDKDDGIFWINIDDLCDQFSDVSANLLHENPEKGERYVYNSLKIPLTGQKRKALVKFVCPQQDTKGYIQLSQKDSRFYNCEPDIEYEYSNIKMIVCNSDYSQYMGDFSVSEREMFVQNDFEANTYYAYIEVDWSENCQDADFVTISAYTNKQVVFKGFEILEDDDCTVLDRMLVCKPPVQDDLDGEEEEDPVENILDNEQITRYINEAAGYFTINYVNYSENLTLKEDVEILEPEFLDIQQPYENSNWFSIVLKPQETKVVKFKINPEGYGDYFYEGINYESEINEED